MTVKYVAACPNHFASPKGKLEKQQLDAIEMHPPSDKMGESCHCNHHIKQEKEKVVRLTTFKHHTEQREVYKV